jgi:hypothetical protein
VPTDHGGWLDDRQCGASGRQPPELRTCVIGQRKADFVVAIGKYFRENANRSDERSDGILYNALLSNAGNGATRNCRGK